MLLHDDLDAAFLSKLPLGKEAELSVLGVACSASIQVTPCRSLGNEGLPWES
jgi:hypothetical protein